MTRGQVGQYGLWAGPLELIDDKWVSTDAVFVMSDDLVKGNAPNLSVARSYTGSASVGDYVIFAGGSRERSNSSSGKSNVDAYDKNLVKSILTNLPYADSGIPGASSGSHAIFSVADWVYADDGVTQFK
jgi:microcompartment protein CcmK/EutM